LGHEESNRSRLAPALPAEWHGERRGHPSRAPSGSLRSPLTGPGRAAGKHSADKREGQALVRRHGRGHTAVMDAEARNQYLRELREEHCLARKAVKSRLLDEAVKRTGLARKVVIRKVAHRGPHPWLPLAAIMCRHERQYLLQERLRLVPVRAPP